MQKSPEQRLAVFEKNTEEGLGTKLMFTRPPYCLNKSYQHSIDSFKKVLIVLINKITNNLTKAVCTSTCAMSLKLSKNLRKISRISSRETLTSQLVAIVFWLGV